MNYALQPMSRDAFVAMMTRELSRVPRYFPMDAELNRRGGLLFFHPCASGICSPMITDYGLAGAAGTSMEDATIVLHLILKQIPVRYPNLRIVIAHLGGLIPMLLQRSTGEPRFIPMAAIDRIVGTAAANALLAGLLAKERTGVGQKIEVPMFETMVQFVLSEHMQGATFDPPTSAPGYARTLSRSRRPYATQDGFLAVLPYNDGQWRRFFEAVGKRRLFAEDPRFADIAVA